MMFAFYFFGSAYRAVAFSRRCLRLSA